MEDRLSAVRGPKIMLTSFMCDTLTSLSGKAAVAELNMLTLPDKFMAAVRLPLLLLAIHCHRQNAVLRVA